MAVNDSHIKRSLYGGRGRDHTQSDLQQENTNLKSKAYTFCELIFEHGESDSDVGHSFREYASQRMISKWFPRTVSEIVSTLRPPVKIKRALKNATDYLYHKKKALRPQNHGFPRTDS